MNRRLMNDMQSRTLHKSCYVHSKLGGSLRCFYHDIKRGKTFTPLSNSSVSSPLLTLSLGRLNTSDLTEQGRDNMTKDTSTNGIWGGRTRRRGRFKLRKLQGHNQTIPTAMFYCVRPIVITIFK